MRNHKVIKMNSIGQLGISLPQEIMRAMGINSGDMVTFEILTKSRLKLEFSSKEISPGFPGKKTEEAGKA